MTIVTPAYFVVGGMFLNCTIEGSVELVYGEQDDLRTAHLFTMKREADDYGRDLLEGEASRACIGGKRYSYARVHTVNSDGRISSNSYFAYI